MASRVFYYAPVSNDRLNAARGVFLDVPAARNKVLRVCAALKKVGQDAVVVSSVVPVSIWHLFSPPKTHNDDLVPLITVPVVGSYIVKRVIAAFALLLFTIRHVRRDDRVVFYNFFPEYVFSALVLRLMGTPAILDLEDGPNTEDTDLSSRVTRIAYRLLDRLCADRRLTVSHQLAQRMGYETYLPVYGVADGFDGTAMNRERFLRDELHVLFSGTITRGSGADLFGDTVKLLAKHHAEVALHIHLTGHYDQGRMAALVHDISGRGRLSLELHGLLSQAEYRSIANLSAVGLCLKLPSRGVGQTTFPSKVIEIAADGMLLVTMDVSDMRMIFNDTSAVILRSEDPEELATTLVWIEANRGAAAKRAKAGQRLVKTTYSSEAVGRKLRRFLFG